MGAPHVVPPCSNTRALPAHTRRPPRTGRPVGRGRAGGQARGRLLLRWAGVAPRVAKDAGRAAWRGLRTRTARAVHRGRCTPRSALLPPSPPLPAVSTQGGGIETTIMTALTQFTHHGMIFVPPGVRAAGRPAAAGQLAVRGSMLAAAAAAASLPPHPPNLTTCTHSWRGSFHTYFYAYFFV